MFDLLHHLILLIPLLYEIILFINLRSSKIFCLSSKDIYLSLSSSSFVTELFCGEVFETFANLSAILLSIKSTAASAIF